MQTVSHQPVVVQTCAESRSVGFEDAGCLWVKAAQLEMVYYCLTNLCSVIKRSGGIHFHIINSYQSLYLNTFQYSVTSKWGKF